MPPAMSRPWLVTLRSTMKSTIPTRIRITPIAGDIIGTVPSGRQIDMQMTVASSLESDCTAHVSTLRPGGLRLSARRLRRLVSTLQPPAVACLHLSMSARCSVARRSCARENPRGAPTHQNSCPTSKAELLTSEGVSLSVLTTRALCGRFGSARGSAVAPLELRLARAVCAPQTPRQQTCSRLGPFRSHPSTRPSGTHYLAPLPPGPAIQAV